MTKTIHEASFLANRIYFVLNGLLNGEEGVQAIPAGGGDDDPQEDGWYYFQNDGDADGVGPYASEDAAKRAAQTFDGQDGDDEDIQQNIMDACYARWQGHKWSKEEFLAMLTPKEKFVVCTGNLNYQVCNGGFSQWGPCNTYGTLQTTGFLRLQLDRLVRANPEKFPACQQVLTLLGDYHGITSFDKDGDPIEPRVEDEADDAVDAYGDLDTAFYKINDAWLVELRAILKNWEA